MDLQSAVISGGTFRSALAPRPSSSEERYRQIVTVYSEQLSRIMVMTDLHPDSLASATASHSGRQRVAAPRAGRLFEAALRDPRFATPLPPAFPDYLFENGDWEVFPKGIERVILEATMIRSARGDSAAF